MNFDNINIAWEWEDLIKIVFSLIAGFVLGMEREWKDKSAGFKTIAIICLGSTLFTILSYKLGAGNSEDATRIASYVVSGIGFLGAGVIFKEGANVNGLTTASIIWISAAIGMSIGFGQYIMAAVVLLACLAIIAIGPIFSRYVATNVAKVLEIHMDSKDLLIRKEIIMDIKKYCRNVKIKQVKYSNHQLIVTLDIVIDKSSLNAVDQYLIERKEVTNFEY
ncbi:MgtC/SapB family protein [Chryseobacterium sp.]|uniref:MgtC/SapB family protein n=1 Tax=Chryseobacterium sp. TaxID=1871047 RepID=UPI00388F858A